jgi:branched-chain amino acid aminotransferase
MHPIVYHNGRLLPLSEARLSPGQAGLLHGWGVFSTLRVYDGRPFAFERHWKRLSNDACRIELPLEMPQQAAADALARLIAVNHAREALARVYFIFNKVTIWAGDEPAPAADVLMYTTDRPLRVGPTQLCVHPHGRHAAHPLAGVKVTSWLENVWNIEKAHKRGFEDALLLNERGEVAECTAANIFWVRSGQVFTTPLSAGCLPGVTREILLEIASAAGMPIHEKALALDELNQAEEVFISSTSREVQAIGRIDEREFPAPGPVTTRLAGLFSDYVRNYFSG